MTRETNLQKQLLLAAPARFPDLRLFRRNVGTARMPSGAIVEFAIGGQADLYGILRGGQTLALETLPILWDASEVIGIAEERANAG